MTGFLARCEEHAAPSIAAVQPLHVAAWIEGQTRKHSAPTVKQQIAAIRHLFDWLVMGQVVPLNPAASVRGPAHSACRGKTPVLDPADDRALLDSIDVITTIERIVAALAMRVEDVFAQSRRLWVGLHEKGGKRHEMPRHHTSEGYLHAYLDGTGIADDAKGPLFRTTGRGTGRLTRTPCPRPMAWCSAMHSRPRSQPGSATTAFGRRGSPPT
ncbi:hypothetical protein [Lichenicoccus sp.]|uniref:hypothetical protein n=1 Tax=Lichenicoccus sp. TaxID=2781899 RepID=UPI003D11B050